MKYIDEFRDGALARRIGRRIAAEARSDRSYHLMEFCGGHTHAISRYGIKDLLPGNVKMVHGPGCPVCVLPIGRIDNAIELASRHAAIVCTYADTMRVPASNGLSMMRAKARGADIRMVYSAADALRIAQDNPAREVVFFAIGFETTTPPTALVIRQAQALALANFTVFCNHVLTPAAITHILESPEVRELGIVPLDGFIGPAHVSTVIGSQPYEYFAEEYQRPVVIAGFEPLDVMQAILMLVRQLNEGRAEVENEFTRAVTREGNEKSQGTGGRCLRAAPLVRVARPRRSALLGAAHQGSLFRLRRRAPLWHHLSLGPGQQGVRMRRDFARREEAGRLQGVRHCVHAGEPDRFVHGQLRRRMRRALRLRPLQGRRGPRRMKPGKH